jgi:hypothetical protein
VQVVCPEISRDSYLIHINKNYPILTDGTDLYTVFKKLKTVKKVPDEKVTRKNSKIKKEEMEGTKDGAIKVSKPETEGEEKKEEEPSKPLLKKKPLIKKGGKIERDRKEDKDKDGKTGSDDKPVGLIKQKSTSNGVEALREKSDHLRNFDSGAQPIMTSISKDGGLSGPPKPPGFTGGLNPFADHPSMHPISPPMPPRVPNPGSPMAPPRPPGELLPPGYSEIDFSSPQANPPQNPPHTAHPLPPPTSGPKLIKVSDSFFGTGPPPQNSLQDPFDYRDLPKDSSLDYGSMEYSMEMFNHEQLMFSEEYEKSSRPRRNWQQSVNAEDYRLLKSGAPQPDPQNPGGFFSALGNSGYAGLPEDDFMGGNPPGPGLRAPGYLGMRSEAMQQILSRMMKSDGKDIPPGLIEELMMNPMEEGFPYEDIFRTRGGRGGYSRVGRRKGAEKRGSKKVEPQETAVKEQGTDDCYKFLEFWLMKFDVNEKKYTVENNSDELQETARSDGSGGKAGMMRMETLVDDQIEATGQLVEELYSAFDGLFSVAECKKAFLLSGEDIELASQWLIEEGEKERTKRNLRLIDKTLLVQSQITSDISAKALRNNAEVTVKKDSLLFPQNTYDSIWTMNDSQVTVGESKVFSILKRDEHIISPEFFEESDQEKSFITPDRGNDHKIFSKHFLTEKFLGDNLPHKFFGGNSKPTGDGKKDDSTTGGVEITGTFLGHLLNLDSKYQFNVCYDPYNKVYYS